MRKVMIVGLGLVAVVTVLVFEPLQAQDAPSVSARALAFGGSRIGVAVRDVGIGDSSATDVVNARGVVTEAVTPESPAARAGVMVGDALIKFDGARVRSACQFARLV